VSTQAHKLALITVTHLLQEKTNAIWDCNFAYLLFNRVVKQLISLIMLITRLIFFKSCINCSFNAHFICNIFQFVCVPSAGRRGRPTGWTL